MPLVTRTGDETKLSMPDAVGKLVRVHRGENPYLPTSYVNDSSLFWLRVARRLSAAALDEMVERPNHQKVHGGAHAGDAQLKREMGLIN